MHRLLIVWIGKFLHKATSMRGGGSALPGLVVEKLSPGFMANNAGRFGRVVLVAGTNGKTTTTKMARHILEAHGHQVLSNVAGSNMPRGVISAILSSMDWRGDFSADIGLFEVDEGFIGQLARDLQPEAIVALNLLRDQLDRYGELNRTARLIGGSLKHAKVAILNADDPRVASLASDANETVFFGADSKVRDEVPHDDILHGSAAVKSDAPSEPNLPVRILESVRTKSGQQVTMMVDGSKLKVKLQIPGVFNAYNAAAATAIAKTMKVSDGVIKDSLEQVKPAFGRSEQITIDNKHITLLLVKNPSGFNQTISTYLTDNSKASVMVAINDNYADGRDVSWLWDVNIEKLKDTPKNFIASGIRGFDMALRFQYADIECESVPELEPAIEELLAKIPAGGQGYIVPTYTAMLEVRKILSGYVDLEEVV